ncbi:MAG: DUF2357 domain-containing protein [Lachnospiraceae bacterium]|nr:DUF2357 domain-containing protein [Lachnospiraceae bacterium]
MEDITINDLYLKYTDGIGEALEDDRYFQYLFEIVQAGNNTLQQKHRILHKVVDEQWLTVVEEGITAIFNIVDKPRRFITTTEEVVPVALAKKITADSVRHLSQNTQFIAANAKGEIQPTKILNVTTEESYDLYENRFVYHLIQRLFAFVDKRTDVIFWATGDETCDVMSMESTIDDAYEEISYKVEMKIKNRQSLVENDTDNMSIFKRIDRVRRMSRTLRASSFCDIMNGCARVHSPIQRTNLMMKDPDYRTCYKLWQFIENYDEVGYSIEEQDSALEFDEEYLLQMYINLITNYTVFKSLLESDPRKMSEIAQEKREPVKPKFIKEIKEEIVDDYNIPDVEVRKVIIEEVTQAQLDAEAKLAEETARREELEQSLAGLNSQLDFLNQQLEDMQNLQMQTEGEKAAIEAELDAEKSARTAAEEAAEATRAQARTEIDAAQAEAKEAMEAARAEVQEAKEHAAQELQQARAEAREQVAQAEAKAADEMQQAQAEAKARITALETKAAEEAAALEKEKTAALIAAEKDAESRIAALQAEAQRQIAEAQREAEAEVERIRWETQEQIARSQKEAESQVAAAQEAAKAEAAQIRGDAERKVQAAQAEMKAAQEMQEQAETAKKAAEKSAAAAQLEAEQAAKEAEESSKKCEEAKAQAALAKTEAQNQIDEEKQAAQREMEALRKSCEAAVAAAESAKEKAIAKAQANSLSKYLVTALRERKERRNTKEDDK